MEIKWIHKNIQLILKEEEKEKKRNKEQKKCKSKLQ